MTFVHSGGFVDPGTVGGQHWLCGGALQEVPHSARSAAEFPEDRAEPGHSERGTQHGHLVCKGLREEVMEATYPALGGLPDCLCSASVGGVGCGTELYL